MEHYEIGEMFGTRRGAKLQFWAEVRNGSYSQQGNMVKCEIIIGIENVGRGIAKYPFLRIWDIPASGPATFGLDGNGAVGLPQRPSSINSEYIFGGSVSDVVYPGIRLAITKFFHFAKYDEISGVHHFTRFHPKYELAAENMAASNGDLLINPAVITNAARGVVVS